MKHLHILVRDVLDTDDSSVIQAVIAKYTLDAAFDLSRLLTTEPRAVMAIYFHEIWFEVFQIHPCFTTSKDFLDLCIGKQQDPRLVFDYMRKTFPWMQFLQFNEQLIDSKIKGMDAASTRLHLIRKLKYRYGLFNSVSQLTSLQQVYKHNHSNNLQLICDALAQCTNAHSFVVPSKYCKYDVHERIILHYNLRHHNIFNDFYDEDMIDSPCSVFDAIAALAMHPSMFYTVLNANVFVLPNENLSDYIHYQPKDVLYFLPFKPNHKVNAIQFCHPILLNYIPKVAKSALLFDSSYASPCRAKTRTYYYLESGPPPHVINHKGCFTVKKEPTRCGYWIPDAETSVGKEYIKLLWERLMEVDNTDSAHVYHQFVTRYFFPKEKEIVQKFRPQKNNENCILLIETRKNVASLLSLLITYFNLETAKWSVHVVCNKQFQEYATDLLGDQVSEVTFDTSELPRHFSLDLYNNILKSPEFWSKLLHYKRVLLIQDDGMLVKPGLETSEFLDYDYVGAPWSLSCPGHDILYAQTKGRMVGNGGFSLRSPRAMRDICEDNRIEKRRLHFSKVLQEPEDVFFARLIKNAPSLQTASSFASEQHLTRGSYGFHKPWPYHPAKETIVYFNGYLSPLHTLDTAFLDRA